MKYEEIGKLLDEEFSYWAMDQDGSVWVYANTPSPRDFSYGPLCGNSVKIPFQITEKPENWRTSLRTKIKYKTPDEKTKWGTPCEFLSGGIWKKGIFLNLFSSDPFLKGLFLKSAILEENNTASIILPNNSIRITEKTS
jgi:hypothetical protein